MYSFIVLGILPGTNFQISFDMWLEFVTSLTIGLFTIFIGRILLHLVQHRDELVFLPASRTPLYASQLHLRA